MHAVVCVTTFGHLTTGGGLFAIEGGHVETIDCTSSHGFATDGRRVARALHCDPHVGDAGEVLVYDARGVSHYLRLDDATAAHDVSWDGDEIVVVSPWTNTVGWYGLDGARRREVRLPGPQDSWHVNCVAQRDGRWYATVFGDFQAHRGWAPPTGRGRGRLIDLETREIVVEGLSSPHSPRLVGDRWFVCDSADESVAEFDATSGRNVRRVPCGGWTRGLAITPEFAFVGVSGDRLTKGRRRAEIVVLDRASWTVAERFSLPSQEVYDVTLIPPELVGGLRTGFQNNPTRIGEARQRDLLRELGVDDPTTLWPAGEALAEADSRCSIEAQFPATCTAGDLLEIPVSVTNRGNAFFTSAPPFPTAVSYRWFDARGNLIVQGRETRSLFPASIPPNGTSHMICRVAVPRAEGAVTLTITLVQDRVRWFDELGADNAISGGVVVRRPLQLLP
jgi:acetolactate synthase-1/2/3 large subunit